MDDRLIAQINTTASSLREAADAADKELADARDEKAAIETRIDQLQSLRNQLRSAIKEAERTASDGGRAGARKATRKKATSKKASRKKATRKKATRKKGARKAARKKSTAAKASTTSAGVQKATPVVPSQ